MLTRLDAALIEMRRLWSPTTSGRAAEGAASAVDLSSVLVAHLVGEADGSLTVAEVADLLSVAAATASRLCDRAVAGGYLQKAPSRDDARRRTLTLTDAGLDLREHSLAFRRDYLEHLLADWTVDEIASFEGLLTRFAASVSARPPRPKPLHAPEGEHR
ncbi:hypothetical protein ASF63_18665 [Microbacterium sp. Leaf320]|nr:hypothetical protein ASF63_18665 [Microbacterium sp. Leaf320]